MKDKNKKVKSNSKKYLIILIVVTFICIFAEGYLISLAKKSTKEVSINYSEKSNIDYKVYLKENSFFDTPYLEKNKTYITSLIDYILVDFDYTFDINANTTGSYSYYIMGTLSANKSNSSDSYWSKDYILSEKITKNYEDLKNFNIKSSVKINYQVYNNLLNEFKNLYALTMDGNLKVSLVIENNINNELINRTVVKSSNLDLNIPLTTLTIEVPISTKELNNSGTLYNDVINDYKYYNTIKYFGIVCFSLAFILVLFIIILLIRKSRLESKFNKKLKKILKTYDNIIVNTDKEPDIKKLNVVNVLTFEELIDAHGEVRKPINYILSKNKASFILISDGMAWRYDLIGEKGNGKK